MTPILAAPATMDTEMVQPGQPFLNSSQHASKDMNGVAESVAGPSAVAVDMESPDVRAERDRVAGMTSFENECIVIRDLRKVYPPQVGLGVYACVCTVRACMQQCDAISALLPSNSSNPHMPPLTVSTVEWSSVDAFCTCFVLHRKQ